MAVKQIVWGAAAVAAGALGSLAFASDAPVGKPTHFEARDGRF